MTISGFILMIFAFSEPVLLWVAWPLIASGGITSHISNVTMCRAIPSLTTALQALVAGCLSASASVPVIWRLMREVDFEFETIFIIWTAAGSFIILVKLILFSPKKLPAVINAENPYSLMKNSVPLRLCYKKDITDEKLDPHNASKRESPSFLFLFKDVKLWLLWVAYNAFSLRMGKCNQFENQILKNNILVSFQSWLGAGWPEWTAETTNGTDPNDFNADINSVFAILSISLIAINFVAGSIVDFCRRKFATEKRPARGVGRVSKSVFIISLCKF